MSSSTKQVCSRCGGSPSQMRSLPRPIGDPTPAAMLCFPSCYELVQRELFEASPEEVARRQRHEAEMAALAERHKRDALRPPNPQHECAIGGERCGRAEIFAAGMALCRSHAESLMADYDPTLGDCPIAEPPIVLQLERALAALRVEVAELKAASASRVPKKGQAA